jgi:beta-barrel assembly-enhancing protease
MAKGRLMIALVMALFALGSYFFSGEVNPITGEKQRVALKPDQEIALGLQAAPKVAQQHGGLSPDNASQRRVDAVGQRLIAQSLARQTKWRYDFHVLADQRVVNAFALPGGQIFITQALLDKFTRDDQLAGVLAHEMTHVIARHGAQRLAKDQLIQGLSGAATVATGDYTSGQMAAMIGQVVGMQYGREDELESDRLGVQIMYEAGYDPRAMIEVMQILAQASGAGRQPEFFSTHPSPDNRIEKIEEAIAALPPRRNAITNERR